VLGCAFVNEVGVATTRIEQFLFQFAIFGCQDLLVDQMLALLVHKSARWRAMFLEIAIGQVFQRFVEESLILVKRLSDSLLLKLLAKLLELILDVLSRVESG